MTFVLATLILAIIATLIASNVVLYRQVKASSEYLHSAG